MDRTFHRLEEDEEREGKERALTAYGSPPHPGHLLQLPVESSCRGGKCLAVSGMHPPELQAEVGTSESGTEKGGSRCSDIRADLFGGGKIGPTIRARDMGPDTAYAESDGRIPP